MTPLVSARLVSVALLPLLAALIGPEPFGPFAAFLGVVQLLWIVACGRYEAAIVAATNAAEARLLVLLSWRVAGGMLAAVAFFSIVSFLCLPALQLVQLPQELAVYVTFALQLALIARVAMRIEMAIATRQGRLGVLSGALLVQSCVQPAVTVMLWVTDTGGLVALMGGDVAGHAAAALTMRASRDRLGPIEGSLKALAGVWRHMPLLNLPGSLLSVAFVVMPSLLLPFILDAATAGHAAIALRLLDMPVQLVGAVASPMLQRLLLVTRFERQKFLRALFALALVSAVSTATVALSVMALSPWLTGTSWAGLAHVVLALAPFATGLALAGPLIELVPQARAEYEALLIHACVFFGVVAIGFAVVEGSGICALLVAVTAISIARSIAFAVLLVKVSHRSQ